MRGLLLDATSAARAAMNPSSCSLNITSASSMRMTLIEDFELELSSDDGAGGLSATVSPEGSLLCVAISETLLSSFFSLSLVFLSLPCLVGVLSRLVLPFLFTPGFFLLVLSFDTTSSSLSSSSSMNSLSFLLFDFLFPSLCLRVSPLSSSFFTISWRVLLSPLDGLPRFFLPLVSGFVSLSMLALRFLLPLLLPALVSSLSLAMSISSTSERVPPFDRCLASDEKPVAKFLRGDPTFDIPPLSCFVKNADIEFACGANVCWLWCTWWD
uniref:Uncharacterized protein n=1 Tax=Cacopsylla melanoneura TaxID=428564 RepID=A0A8D8TQ75_9HEMI